MNEMKYEPALPPSIPIPIPTITPTPEPVDSEALENKNEYKALPTVSPESTEENSDNNKGFLGLDSGSLLPVIGGVILILLGILFVILMKYMKQKDEIEG